MLKNPADDDSELFAILLQDILAGDKRWLTTNKSIAAINPTQFQANTTFFIEMYLEKAIKLDTLIELNRLFHTRASGFTAMYQQATCWPRQPITILTEIIATYHEKAQGLFRSLSGPSSFIEHLEVLVHLAEGMDKPEFYRFDIELLLQLRDAKKGWSVRDTLAEQYQSSLCFFNSAAPNPMPPKPTHTEAVIQALRDKFSSPTPTK